MNALYPIFLQAHRLRFLIIGGGAVGEEKLHNLLRSSPEAQVRLVAPEIRPGIWALAAGKPAIHLIQEAFSPEHFAGIDIVLVATADAELNRDLHAQAKAHGLLTNVADTPDLCDFYMGSIVTKGDLKIGISTNGRSPTLAKRLRAMLEAVLPDEIDELLTKLSEVRDRLKGDFGDKVKQLNAVTDLLAVREGKK